VCQDELVAQWLLDCMERQIAEFNRRTERLRRPYHLPTPGTDLGECLRARAGTSFQEKFVAWFTDAVLEYHSDAPATATAIVRAIAAGDAAGVRACLDEDAAVVHSALLGSPDSTRARDDADDDDGAVPRRGPGLTPLHWAAIHGRATIAKMLCRHDPAADVLAMERQGAIPLSFAIAFGRDDVVKYLVESPKDGPGHILEQVLHRDCRGRTCLHDAAYVVRSVTIKLCCGSGGSLSRCFAPQQARRKACSRHGQAFGCRWGCGEPGRRGEPHTCRHHREQEDDAVPPIRSAGATSSHRRCCVANAWCRRWHTACTC